MELQANTSGSDDNLFTNKITAIAPTPVPAPVNHNVKAIAPIAVNQKSNLTTPAPVNHKITAINPPIVNHKLTAIAPIPANQKSNPTAPAPTNNKLASDRCALFTNQSIKLNKTQIKNR